VRSSFSGAVDSEWRFRENEVEAGGRVEWDIVVAVDVPAAHERWLQSAKPESAVSDAELISQPAAAGSKLTSRLRDSHRQLQPGSASAPRRDMEPRGSGVSHGGKVSVLGAPVKPVGVGSGSKTVDLSLCIYFYHCVGKKYISTAITFVFRFSCANCSGDRPRLSRTSALAPWARSSFRTPTCPR
jgi:hypothetical protein